MPNYVKVVPSIAIAFVSYEQVGFALLLRVHSTAALHHSHTKAISIGYAEHCSTLEMYTGCCVYLPCAAEKGCCAIVHNQFSKMLTLRECLLGSVILHFLRFELSIGSCLSSSIFCNEPASFNLWPVLLRLRNFWVLS